MRLRRNLPTEALQSRNAERWTANKSQEILKLRRGIKPGIRIFEQQDGLSLMKRKVLEFTNE